MHKTKFIALFIFLSSTLSAYSQNGEIGGKIIAWNDWGIGKAKVALVDSQGVETGRKTVTEFDGNYSLKSLKPGIYHLQISCNGYVSQMEKAIQVNADKCTWVNARLEQAPLKTKGKGKK